MMWYVPQQKQCWMIPTADNAQWWRLSVPWPVILASPQNLGFKNFSKVGYIGWEKESTQQNDSFAFNKWYLHSVRTSFIKHWFQMPPAPVCKAFYTFYKSTHTQSHHSCNAIVQLCLRMDTSPLEYWLSLRWCWWICIE